MDGWSPTYQAGRVKVIGRLINLTPFGSVNLLTDGNLVNCRRMKKSTMNLAKKMLKRKREDTDAIYGFFCASASR
jgi:hypothetical protein